ncbi:MAG: ferredoxin [archaeon]
MTKIRILYNRKLCIGSAACVAMDPKYFELVQGKASLKGAKDIGDEKFELIVETNDSTHHAAAACPVDAIKIEEYEKPEQPKEP